MAKHECPLCKHITLSINKLEKHTKKEHNLSLQQLYLNEFNSGIWPTCYCGCNEKTTWCGWKRGFNKFIRGHNGYLSRLPKIEADSILSKRLNTLQMHISDGTVKPWCTGLTKETDARIEKRTKAITKGLQEHFKHNKHWAKGLTKETDERIANAANALKDVYARGEATPWAKGKSKETDERVRAMAITVSETHNEPALRMHLDDQKRLTREELMSRIKELAPNFKIVNLDDFKRCNNANLVFECNSCYRQKTSSIDRLNNICDICNPGDSAPQFELKQFIRSLGFNPITTRSIIKPYELDAFVAEKNVAFEMNGLYWHNDNKKNDSLYHLRKTELCRNTSIELLHIFTDEWRDKRNIIESMIKHRLGVSQHRIHARKCIIKNVDNASKHEFFEATHLDGDDASDSTLGLYHDDVLVYAMSIKDDVVVKFSCKLEHHVVGGFSRLVKHLNANKVIIDARFESGNALIKIGFKIIKKIEPSFWLTDNINRFKTNDIELGRIWDCGKLVFSY